MIRNDYGPDFSYIFKIWNENDNLSIELSEDNFYGDLVTLESTASVPVNEWTHVSVTYNANDVKLFFNGIEDNSTNASGTIRNSIADLLIGANQFGINTIENFSGLIDEVRVWNVARTQAQIYQDMHNQLRGDEPGLIGYWNFNEGSGTSAFDQSVYGNNGSLQGGVTWIASSAPVLSWLTVTPSSGVVHIEDSMKIYVRCNAKYLQAGYHKNSILVSSNDPDETQIIIPFTVDVITGLKEPESVNIPAKYTLFQNYPNPFNPKTVISYKLKVKSEVELSIYNLLGQMVATLVNKKQAAGSYQVEWDASEFSSGLYLYQLKAKSQRPKAVTANGQKQNAVITKKMLLLK